MREEVGHWLKLALYDLETAEDMLQARRFPYVVFFCHLAVEKALKARIYERTGKTPPKIHDLVALLKLSGLEPPSDIRDVVGRLAGVSTTVRYPSNLSCWLTTYTEDMARAYLEAARRTVEWIREHLKL